LVEEEKDQLSSSITSVEVQSEEDFKEFVETEKNKRKIRNERINEKEQKKRKVEKDIKEQFEEQKDDRYMRNMIGSMMVTSFQNSQILMAKMINGDVNIGDKKPEDKKPENKAMETRVENLENGAKEMNSKLDAILLLLQKKNE
jgi:hypothetical protein